MSVSGGKDPHGNADTTIDDTISVTVTVSDVDEPADISFAATGGVTANDNALAVDENHTGTLATFSASDPENVQTLMYDWSVGGTDRLDFAITDSGVLSFANIPDYERPADSGGNNVYDITASGLDSDGKTSSIDVTVTVERVNEPPTITGDAAPSIEEEGALLPGTYRAAHAESATIAWQPLDGADKDKFTFNTSNRRLSLKAPPDFEDAQAGDNVYNVILSASDGSYTPTLNIAVTVTNKEEVGDRSASPRRSRRPTQTYTATLSDPDGRAVDDVDVGTLDKPQRPLDGGRLAADSRRHGQTAYRPVAGDMSANFLRVTADVHGRAQPGHEQEPRSAVSANAC